VAEVPHALRPRRMNRATLSIVQGLVWLVLGQIGQRARRNVQVASALALDLS
jgi:hypothetical protein